MAPSCVRTPMFPFCSQQNARVPWRSSRPRLLLGGWIISPVTLGLHYVARRSFCDHLLQLRNRLRCQAHIRAWRTLYVPNFFQFRSISFAITCAEQETGMIHALSLCIIVIASLWSALMITVLVVRQIRPCSSRRPAITLSKSLLIWSHLGIKWN